MVCKRGGPVEVDNSPRLQPSNTAMRTLILLLVISAGQSALLNAQQPAAKQQSAARAEIRALDSAFVAAWARDDTASVLALFADDAVLMPPNAKPITGRAAIKAWWWPTDGSHTRILSFERHQDEIGTAGDLAFLRATSSLKWRYSTKGNTTTQTSRSTDLVVLMRDRGGRWRIARQMWNTHP